MKTTSSLLVATVSLCTSTQLLPGSADPALRILESGPHHRVVEWTETIVDEAGADTVMDHRYTVLATGLNWWSPDDQAWIPTVEAFELTPDGYAIAAQGQHKLIIAPNLAQAGSVDLELPNGQRMRSSPMGLSYFDEATGRSVLLAQVKPCVGELVEPRVLVFGDAFDSVNAALRFTYRRSGISQDVIIYDHPGSPDQYDLNPASSRLEILTEFHEAPSPTVTVADSAEGAADQILDFGSMLMGEGRAYVLSQELDDLAVDKSWELLDGRRFLIESIPYDRVAPLLDRLYASAQRPDPAVLEERSFARREELVARLSQPISQSQELAALAPASPQARTGVVLDYNLSGYLTNFTFEGDSTYCVTDELYLKELTTIEGGAVVKSVQFPSIRYYGPVDCQTSFYRPAIFTAKDDDSVGSVISGSSGNPSGTYATAALYAFGNTNLITLENIRVRYAAYGLAFSSNPSPQLRHCQITDCGRAIYCSSGAMRAQNVLINHTTSEAIRLYGTTPTFRGEHLTLHAVHQVVNATGVTLTNSILAAVTNWTTSFAGAHNQTNATDSIFDSAGAGDHYLLPRLEGYHDSGSTNISADLAAELPLLTTGAPLTLTGPITYPKILAPVVRNDTGIPDLGYHYPPLHYLASNVVLQAELTLTNGVVVGTCGSQAFHLQTSESIRSEGSPLRLNRLVQLQDVQERARGWGSGVPFYQSSSNYAPDLRFRFTELCPVPGVVGAFFSVIGDCPLREISFHDCTLRGGSLSLYPVSSSYVKVAFTNNLIEHCNLTIGKGYYAVDSDLWVDLYNNLFREGEITLHYYEGDRNPYWCVRDNLFDGAGHNFYKDAHGDQKVQRDHNGFTSGTYYGSYGLSGSSDITNLTADFESGPLGDYYYPSSGSTPSLATLIGAGSRAATNAALYHYTTTTNQSKELSSTVDIGFHYVALTNAVPRDDDGDRLPDYAEDRNGDGDYDPGSDFYNWQNAHSITNANGLSLSDRQNLALTVNTLVTDPAQDVAAGDQNTQDEAAIVVFDDTVVVAWVDSNLGVPGYGRCDNCGESGEWCPEWQGSGYEDLVPQFIGWGRSLDGGVSFTEAPIDVENWTGPLPLFDAGAAEGRGNAGDPVLARDTTSGKIYLVGNPERRSTGQVGDEDLYLPVWTSTNYGASFGPAINATPYLGGRAVYNEFLDKPWIVVDNYAGGGSVYVVFLTNPTSASGKATLISRLAVGSTNWVAGDTNSVMTASAPTASPMLAVLPNHHVLVSWRFDTAGQSEFRFARSTDLGATFTLLTASSIEVNKEGFGDLRLLRYNGADQNDYFRAPIASSLAVNPSNSHIYLVNDDFATASATSNANIHVRVSTNEGASWSSAKQVNDDTTICDQWQPSAVVKPDGTKLFIAWYDRRNSNTNHMIEVWGVIANLPLTGTNSFYGKNFRIGPGPFPPVFAGDHDDFKPSGMFDPAYPPLGRGDDGCPVFGGVYAHHMGDYDMVTCDNEHVYYVWRDSRDIANSRYEASVRLAKIPWD